MHVGMTADPTASAHQRREGAGSGHVSQTGRTRQDYAERHEKIEMASRAKSSSRNGREWKFAADHHPVVSGGDLAFDLTEGRANPPLFDHRVSFLYANRVGRSAASPRRRRLSSS